MNEAQACVNRRDMLRDGARYAALGGLAILSAKLGLRRSKATRCTLAPACGNCSALASCGLPQAEAAREATKVWNPVVVHQDKQERRTSRVARPVRA
jgi:hypothetical protein